VDGQVFPKTREDVANLRDVHLVAHLDQAYRDKERAEAETTLLSAQLNRQQGYVKDASRRIDLIKSVLKERL
jgi:hypothetical protein